MKFFKAIDTFIDRFASALLVLSVLLMLFFSVLAIILRWAETSLMWIDPFVRHLVFLSAFLGGTLATGRKTHIGIDILGKFLESKKLAGAERAIGIIVNLAATGTIFWLVISSYHFMKIEFQYGKNVFFGIHSGFLVGIIPISLSLITYRFFYKFLESLFIADVSEEGEV